MNRSRLVFIFLAATLLTVVGLALLISVVERQQQARATFVKVTDIKPLEPDSALWAPNFPREYDGWKKTLNTAETVKYSDFGRYGGSEAFSRLDKYPNLKRLFAGYPFAVEYREEQGHMNAIKDVVSTARLGDAKPGSCFTCKSSLVPTMIKEMGAEKFYATPMKEIMAQYQVDAQKHPIGCADCHDAETMQLQVSRPAFIEAMQRRGIDVTQASRQDMRTYVCAQCHVEYYFKGQGKYVTFPWDKGLRIEDIEAYYNEAGFKDWDHAETKASLIKMQHPEFELWSTGIHARAGVACADCHMPYKREGAVKIADHWIRTPMVNLTNSCGTCHRYSEDELKARVLEIQERTYSQLERADKAIVSAQDAIVAAMNAGVSDEKLKAARDLHRRAFIRYDMLSAENSMGFHSPQEANRVLGDAIDYARQAELAARAAETQK